MVEVPEWFKNEGMRVRGLDGRRWWIDNRCEREELVVSGIIKSPETWKYISLPLNVLWKSFRFRKAFQLRRDTR